MQLILYYIVPHIYYISGPAWNICYSLIRPDYVVGVSPGKTPFGDNATSLLPIGKPTRHSPFQHNQPPLPPRKRYNCQLACINRKFHTVAFLLRAMSPSVTPPPRLPRIQQLGFAPDVSPPGGSHHPALPSWHGPSWSQAPMDHPQAAGPPDHLIVLYMEDTREEPTAEPTMAEIPVPIRFDPAAGAWCVNGNDLAMRLQQTPSRIDGDAKLCTMRGRYKQCFARIADGAVERCWSSPELKLPPEKSLQITVEPNPAPSSRTASLPPADHLLELGKRGTETRPAQTLPGAKKHITSPSPTLPPAQSTTPPPTPGPSRANDINGWRVAGSSASTSSCASPQIQAETPHVNVPTKPKSTKPKESKPEVNAAIVTWLRHRFSTEDPQRYNAFTQSKGKSLPMEDLLQGYRYVAELINQYNDTRTPSDLEGAPDRKISKANIFAALGRQTSWGSDTETTLALVDLYGPGGPREHPKIRAIMEGRYNGAKEGSVGFLHSLKEVDKDFSSKSGGGLNQRLRRPSDASSSR